MRAGFPIRLVTGVLACTLIASGCSTPAAPSASSSTGSEATTAMSDASLTPAELEARGWDCQPAPANPNRLTCVPPNHVHPVLFPGPPPPVDRPASIQLLVFDNGVFVGTDLLIRSDLYNGQSCGSTGTTYRFIGRIGYYECLHQSQGS
jgi:hypothetical protein